MMKQYDRVLLRFDDYRSENVLLGMVGYIIEEYSDGKFEVEFSNPNTGETIALLVLGSDEMELSK